MDFKKTYVIHMWQNSPLIQQQVTPTKKWSQ